MSTNWQDFGKYIINAKQLHEKSVVNIKYKNTGATLSWLKRNKKVSEYLQSIFINILDTNEIDAELLQYLSSEETTWFEMVWTKTNLKTKLNYQKVRPMSDQKRFELLRGLYLVGNDSDKVKEELLQILSRFKDAGRISEEDFTEFENDL